MKEHYVTYDQAVKLKELGFDWKCNQYYIKFADDGEIRCWHASEPDNNNARQSRNEICSAPRLDQVQAWLREVKEIDIEVITILNLAQKTKSYKANLCYFDKNESGEDCANYKIACLNIHSYEKALELGIDKALELLTNKPTAI